MKTPCETISNGILTHIMRSRICKDEKKKRCYYCYYYHTKEGKKKENLSLRTWGFLPLRLSYWGFNRWTYARRILPMVLFFKNALFCSFSVLWRWIEKNKFTAPNTNWCVSPYHTNVARKCSNKSKKLNSESLRQVRVKTTKYTQTRLYNWDFS
jgi:hypothetical protein